jgi:hypothetical protein
MEHSRGTCPIPNCPLCQREKFSDENKAVQAITGKPNQKPVVRWFDAKVVRPLLKLPNPIKIAKPPRTEQYRVRKDEDQAFTPCWRSEPVNYTGRGIVYLFHSEDDAVAWTNQKNAEALKSR